MHSTLTLEHLVSSSNEYRLLLTRLLNIALLEVVGHWDPIVQMLVNAVLHIAALAVLIAMLVRGLPPLLATAFMAAVMFVFVIPFAWENTLWGFQSQFYCLLLMSLLALWTLVSAAAWSMRWWAGLVLGVLAYFGMASGALALFAAAATQVVQMLVRRRHAWGEALGMLTLVAVGLVLVQLVPKLEFHESLKAPTLRVFLSVFTRVAGWPVDLRALGLIIVNLPAVLLAWRLWQVRPDRTDVRWLILALIVWVGLQYAAAAQTRAMAAPLASRYLDVFALGPLANLCALLHLCAEQRSGRVRKVGTAAWAAILAAAFVAAAVVLPQQIAMRRAWGLVHEQVIAEYLRTRDPAAFEGKQRPQELPFYSPSHLATILAEPSVVRVLPPELLPDPTQARRVSRVLTGEVWDGLARQARYLALASPPLLLGGSIALFVVAALCGRRRQAAAP